MEHDDLALERVSFSVKKHEPASPGFLENTTGLPRRNRTEKKRQHGAGLHPAAGWSDLMGLLTPGPWIFLLVLRHSSSSHELLKE